MRISWLLAGGLDVMGWNPMLMLPFGSTKTNWLTVSNLAKGLVKWHGPCLVSWSEPIHNCSLTRQSFVRDLPGLDAIGTRKIHLVGGVRIAKERKMKYGDFAIFVEEEVIFPPIGTGFLRYTIYNIYIYCISLSIYIFMSYFLHIHSIYIQFIVHHIICALLPNAMNIYRQTTQFGDGIEDKWSCLSLRMLRCLAHFFGVNVTMCSRFVEG